MIMRLIKSHSSIFCLVLACFLLPIFSSCENNSATVIDDVKFNISVAEVMKPFKVYDANDGKMFEYNGARSKIVVVAFLYDANGQLVKEFSKEIDDYNQAAVSFETKIDGNNMKLVCFSYATLKDGSTIYNSYKITGKQTISTLKVQRSDFTSANRIPWQIVGGAVANVNLNSNNVNVSLNPLGAVVYYDWENIHSASHTAQNSYVFVSDHNDVIAVNDNWQFEYSRSLPSYYGFHRSIYPSEYPKYTSVYAIQFMMPSDVKAQVGYVKESGSNLEEIWVSEFKYIRVDAGKQYVFSVDCKTHEFALKEGVLTD